MKKTLILGIARHILTTLGGALVTKGWFDSNGLAELVGAIFALIGVIWSLIEKHQAKAAAVFATEKGELPARFSSAKPTKGGARDLMVLLILFSLALSASAQTFRTAPRLRVMADDATATNAPAPAPTIEGGMRDILAAIKNDGTNWWFAVYGLYAPGLDSKYGGGIAAIRPINDYLLAGTRIDYVDGGFSMVSANASLQFPFKVFGVDVTPFTIAGIGLPMSGKTYGSFTVPGSLKNHTGDPTAILGYGLAVKLYSGPRWTIGAAYDRETWTGYTGVQHRFAALANRKF